MPKVTQRVGERSQHPDPQIGSFPAASPVAQGHQGWQKTPRGKINELNGLVALRWPSWSWDSSSAPLLLCDFGPVTLWASVSLHVSD